MQPNLIHIEETCKPQLLATSAVVGASIHGQSFFTGDEAFKKAAELRDLISKLANCGIPQDDVNLIAVTAQSSAGLIGKSSAVKYHIQVRCSSLEALGLVLAAICSQKNAEIFVIDWHYSEYDKTKGDLLDQCVTSAKSRAERLSRSLGVSLHAVHKLTYEFSDADKRSSPSRGLHGYADVKRRRAESLANLDLAHVSTLSVSVKAEFVVTEFAQ